MAAPQREPKQEVLPDTSLAVRANRVTMAASRHWLRWLLVVIGLYVGLPFVAPTFMKLGWTGPANFLYTAYSPLCHQFAFRSWFLFGEQSAYPRGLAGVQNLKPIEDYATDVNNAIGRQANLTVWGPDLMLAAREYIGDERMGYKVALCERDIAIYGVLFLSGLVFSIPFIRQRLRPIPIWLYVLVGLVPIGIDGVSQLLGGPLHIGDAVIFLWPARETIPLFRTLTGGLFGFANAWLAFPYLEESSRATVREIEAKFKARQERLAQQAASTPPAESGSV